MKRIAKNNNVAFVEKYAPGSLKEIVGQPHVVSSLRGFVRAPTSKAFLFVGDPGTGKTSAARCLAADLGVDLSQREFGGLFVIAAGEQTGEAVRAAMWQCRHRPWHGSGWNVLVVNEADNMTPAAGFVWLDALENLPKRTVIVFTTNRGDLLEARFRQRCEVHAFNSAVHITRLNPLEKAANAHIARIWRCELGCDHAPTARDLPGAIVDEQLSIRQCVQALEPIIRAQRRRR